MEKTFKDLQVGDKIIRMLGGKIPLNVVVNKIDNELIHCTIPHDEQDNYRAAVQRGAAALQQSVTEEELAGMPVWTFSINNGAEIDSMLGWDETTTGSYIVKPEKI
jgi:hypothetical protein